MHRKQLQDGVLFVCGLVEQNSAPTGFPWWLNHYLVAARGTTEFSFRNGTNPAWLESWLSSATFLCHSVIWLGLSLEAGQDRNSQMGPGGHREIWADGYSIAG